MNKFTVIMKTPEDVPADFHLSHVEADTALDAQKVGQKDAAFSHHPRRKMADFPIALVLKGHVKDARPVVKAA